MFRDCGAEFAATDDNKICSLFNAELTAYRRREGSDIIAMPDSSGVFDLEEILSDLARGIAINIRKLFAGYRIPAVFKVLLQYEQILGKPFGRRPGYFSLFTLHQTPDTIIIANIEIRRKSRCDNAAHAKQQDIKSQY